MKTLDQTIAELVHDSLTDEATPQEIAQLTASIAACVEEAGFPENTPKDEIFNWVDCVVWGN